MKLFLKLFLAGISPAALEAIRRVGGSVENNTGPLTLADRPDLPLRASLPDGTSKIKGYAIWQLPDGEQLETVGDENAPTPVLRILQERGMDEYNPACIKAL